MIYNNFNKAINNLKEMITNFKDENGKLKKKFENYKVLLTRIEAVDNFVIIATTSTSVPGFGLIVISISTGFGYGSTLINKVLQ